MRVARKRNRGRGRPPLNDDEAVEFVLDKRLINPRLSYRRAARLYFLNNEEKLGNTTLESAARRVADKAMKKDGRRPRQGDADRLQLIAFRLHFLTTEIQALADRLRGELPADGNRTGQRRPSLLTAFISMERIMEEIVDLRLAGSLVDQEDGGED